MDDPEVEVDGSDVLEELQTLGWALQISRDHLLKVVEQEGMPAKFRDRGQTTASQLTDLWGVVRKLTGELPVLGDLPESLAEELTSFCLIIEMTLRDVDFLIGDLQCLQGELNDIYPEEAN